MRPRYKPFPETRATVPQNLAITVPVDLLYAVDDLRREQYERFGDRLTRGEALEFFAWRGMRQ